jgi:hypothetical protein
MHHGRTSHAKRGKLYTPSGHHQNVTDPCRQISDKLLAGREHLPDPDDTDAVVELSLLLAKAARRRSPSRYREDEEE